MNVQGYDFRKWIEAGYRDYGKDPWFFIRELAQNSRDAGAAFIRVNIGYTSAKEEVLVFEDDGCGMSYDHAVSYLFRLYASSKSNEKYAAGLFGIGFWTVLRFNPKTVIIESWNNKEQWGVKVDVGVELTTTRTDAHLKHKGTRVTLIRTSRETSSQEFWKKTRTALVRYCSYLRRNTRKAEPLPVYFSGENITGEMKLPGPVSMRFNTNLVEGAVGLGPRPRVHLYARGLPVWKGTSLEELSHTPPTPSAVKKQHQQEIGMGKGLAPVFLLNGNRLEVNISRKRVIDNRNLQKVHKTAEKALAQMVEAAADSISPRGWLQQIWDIIKRKSAFIFGTFTKVLLLSLLVIIPLEVILLRSLYKAPQEEIPRAYITLQASQRYYSGASVRVTDPCGPLDLIYNPPLDTWFKLFTADKYHISSGFLQTFDRKEEIPFISLHCSQDGISVELNTREQGKIFLPQPVGYKVELDSITLNRVSMGHAGYYPGGEVIVSIPSGGTIRYRCCPVRSREITALSAAQQKKLTELPPGLSFPFSIEKELQDSRQWDIAKKLETALRLTTDLLKYDDSLKTAKRYARSPIQGDWFRKVTSIGAGDCDILNGVAALFLRKMGIPAQLVVGFVGKKGKLLPGLHAWTEYFDKNNRGRRWNIIDASAHIPRVSTVSNSPLTKKGQKPGILEESLEIGTRGKEGLSYKMVVYSLMLVLFFLLLILFFILFRARRSREVCSFPPRQFRQVQEDLAAMVLHELLHPGAWGREGRIRNYKLIPAINSKPGLVSLGQVLKLGTLGKLFTLNINRFTERAAAIDILEPGTLLARLKQASVPILDSGNPAFAPLVKLLPGAVHLEGVFALGAEIPGKAAEVGIGVTDLIWQLLAAVNQRLQSLGRKMPLCVLAPGLETADFYDVDLSALPSLEKWGLPKRFIAVNPGSKRVKELAHLFQKNPGLAQFRLIVMLLKESGLISYPAAVVIEKVSQQLLNKKLLWEVQGGGFLEKSPPGRRRQKNE
jgi:hypothetical protein